LSAQQYLEDSSGGVDPVPDDQPPAPDMPPLFVMVLDALADDAETIYTMRNCGDMEPYGIALVGEDHLRRTLRALLRAGLIEIEEETLALDDHHLVQRRPPGPAPTTDADLRRYWYVMTPAGWKAWQAGRPERDAYWDSHPFKPPR
jgi:hypothetical protein